MAPKSVKKKTTKKGLSTKTVRAKRRSLERVGDDSGSLDLPSFGPGIPAPKLLPKLATDPVAAPSRGEIMLIVGLTGSSEATVRNVLIGRQETRPPAIRQTVEHALAHIRAYPELFAWPPKVSLERDTSLFARVFGK